MYQLYKFYEYNILYIYKKDYLLDSSDVDLKK